MRDSETPEQDESEARTPGILETMSMESLSRIASMFWALPSMGAVAILLTQPTDKVEGAAGVARLEALRIEHWLALVILLIQAFFSSIWMTETLSRRVSRRSEPEEASEERRN